MKNINQEKTNKDRASEQGFSLIEMIVVIAIITVVSTIAILSLTTQKMHEAESQALLIVDVLQEARQRSLSQRSTMRVELNSTLQMIRLIDEKEPDDASDDVLVKASRYMGNGVYIGSKPSNVSNTPTELSPVPIPNWGTSNHPLSSGNNLAVLRFQKNGTVVNAGTTATGLGATPTGSTIYVWSKYPSDTSTNPTTAQVARAITVLASSGSTKMWKCLITDGTCSTWTR